jgi:hypothetical protein
MPDQQTQDQRSEDIVKRLRDTEIDLCTEAGAEIMFLRGRILQLERQLYAQQGAVGPRELGIPQFQIQNVEPNTPR